MKYQGMVLSFLLAVVLVGTTAPAKAAEAPASAAVQSSALGVSSYKGNSLTAGEWSMVVVSPYGTHTSPQHKRHCLFLESQCNRLGAGLRTFCHGCESPRNR